MNNFLKKVRKLIPKLDRGVIEKKQVVQPSRDWLISILLFTIIMASGGAIAAKLFVDYSELDLSSSTDGVEVPKYSEDLIKEAIDKYRNKATEYQKVNITTVIPAVTESVEIESNIDTDSSDVLVATSSDQTESITTDVNSDALEEDVVQVELVF